MWVICCVCYISFCNVEKMQKEKQIFIHLKQFNCIPFTIIHIHTWILLILDLGIFTDTAHKMNKTAICSWKTIFLSICFGFLVLRSVFGFQNFTFSEYDAYLNLIFIPKILHVSQKYTIYVLRMLHTQVRTTTQNSILPFNIVFLEFLTPIPCWTIWR